MFDTLQIVFIGALKGAGDTRFVLASSMLVSAISVLVGWYGDAYHGGQLLWWWSVVTVWIFALSVVYSMRFIQGRWRDMLVIERSAQEPTDDAVLVNTSMTVHDFVARVVND